MWIRVQSFLQESTEAAQTLDCSIGTCSEPGVYFTSGRKAGDVTFEQDKSVSRKHCLLRCVGDYDGLLKPRNQAERDACAQNPMGVCLVLESSGKAGCYIAELPPKSTVSSGDAADGANDDSNAVDSEDEETDDEGISQRPSQHHAPPASQQQQQPQQQQPSQSVPKATTSSSSSSSWQVTQWGEGTVVTDVQQAPATKRILGDSSSQAKLVKLNVGESRVLNFADAVMSKSNKNDEGDGYQYQREYPTLAIQIGLNISVLQITWIPLALTFSRLPKNWNHNKQDLYKIGAIEETGLSADTTHLVTPEYGGTAKPLAAWCKGIPVVTPGFVEALLGRTSCTDPVPTETEHRAAIKSDLNFFLTKPNPQLLSPYIVLTIDEGEVEALIQFAGAQVVPLHSLSDADAALAKAQEVIQQAQSQNLVCLVLASRKKLHNEVAALDHVFSVKVNVFAKAISQQNPVLKDAKGKTIALPGVDTTSSSTTSSRQQRHGTKDDASTSASSSFKKPSSSYMNDDTITDVTNEPYTMTTAAHDSVDADVDVDASISVAPYATETTVTYPSTTSTAAAQQEEYSTTTSRSARSKTRARENRSFRASSPMEEEEESFSHKDGDFEAEPKSGRSMDLSMEDDEPSPPTTRRTPADSSDGGLGASGQGGWFTVAPKDDEQRKAIRNRASRECEQNDGMKFEPAALSERTIQLSSLSNTTQAAPRSTNPFRSGRQGPNFSRFRKNTVPDRDSSFQVHFVKVLPKESELEKQLSENQRELEEEERRADELFRDTASAVTRKRRRR